MSKEIWNKEYKNPTFVSKDTRASDDVRAFVKFLKKKANIDYIKTALDVGCGIGKHTQYLADVIADEVYAYDISDEAINEAKATNDNSHIYFEARSIEEGFPLKEKSVGLVVDWMTSHLLSDYAYSSYISGLARVCESGAYVCVRTFKKEGDSNATQLLSKYPSGEADTYIHPELGVAERVFTKDALLAEWGKYFDCVHIESRDGYQRFGNQSYKRQYWIAYFRCR